MTDHRNHPSKPERPRKDIPPQRPPTLPAGLTDPDPDPHFPDGRTDPPRGKRIRILFVLPGFDQGGSEKLVFDIIRHLDRDKYAPVLAVFFSGHYETEFKELGLPFYVVHEGSPRSKWKTARFLSDIVRRHDIDIVSTHHVGPLIQGVLPFKVLNTTTWVHTEHTRLDLEPDLGRRHIWMERVGLKYVDVAVGIAHSVVDYLETDLWVPAAKIRLILNGVAVERFGLHGFDRTGYRKACGFGEDAFLIGMFANFRAQKNHANLIEAIHILKQRNGRNIKVVLCGAGPLLGDVRERIRALGLEEDIHILGARGDIPELMNILDVYTLPSLFEGLPFSLLEAMAACVPVVATDVVGIRDVVTNDENALLVPSDDAMALAGALEKMINNEDLRERVAVAGRETAGGLSFQGMMGRYDALFSSVLQRNGDDQQ